MAARKRTKPKVVWANAINLCGLWSDKPIRMSVYDWAYGWYNRKNDLDVHKLGVDDGRPGIITFASEKRSDVVLWTKGALAMAQRMCEDFGAFAIAKAVNRMRGEK